MVRAARLRVFVYRKEVLTIMQCWKGDRKLLFVCFQYISPGTPYENLFAWTLALQGKNTVKSRFAELLLREHT